MTSLQEEDGCVTGVQYREKDTGKIKVHTHTEKSVRKKVLLLCSLPSLKHSVPLKI